MNTVLNLMLRNAVKTTQIISENTISTVATKVLPSGVKVGIFVIAPNYLVKGKYGDCVRDLSKLGLNQNAIAKLLEISPSTVSRLVHEIL